jgi:hypothetical protein
LNKSYLAAQPAGKLNLSFTIGGDYLNDVQSTTVDGDSFEYTFKGTGIRLITPTGPDQGDVDVYVDGQWMQTVNAYSQSRLTHQEIYSISGLASGFHTLKAVKKSGNLMLTDQLKFTVPSSDGGTNPTETPTPTPTATPSPTDAGSPNIPVQPSATPTLTPTPTPTAGADGSGGKEDAETMRHTAYINGYPGGFFKPDAAITRAEMATILAKVAAKDATGADVKFSDVPSSYWGADAIAKVAKMGLMKGYSDGTFKPNQPLTRAEMASLAAMLSPNSTSAGRGFSDISGHWAQAAIKKAQDIGIMKGYSDGTFRPNAKLTRAEAVTAINRVLGRGPLIGVTQPGWNDVPISHWAFGDIEEASTDHVSKPSTQGGEQWTE